MPQPREAVEEQAPRSPPGRLDAGGRGPRAACSGGRQRMRLSDRRPRPPASATGPGATSRAARRRRAAHRRRARTRWSSASPIAEMHILWISEGMSCDGDTISITAADQPSIEDVVLGLIPACPRSTCTTRCSRRPWAGRSSSLRSARLRPASWGRSSSSSRARSPTRTSSRARVTGPRSATTSTRGSR